MRPQCQTLMTKSSLPASRRGKTWAARRLPSLFLPVWLLASGCQSEPGNGETATRNSAHQAPTAATVESPRPTKGQRVTIPLGRFEAGTLPGTLNRDPELEPALAPVTLGAFAIDALPFPNDPDVPPTLVSTADDAARSCAEAGGRLCTELEWERACKGKSSHPFVSGATFDCDGLLRCRNDEGVYGQGLFREFTGSHFSAGSELAGKVVFRGADGDAAVESRRCSHRSTGTGPAAFRCCYGAPNGVKIEEPDQPFVFEKVALSKERLMELLKADPRTAELAADVMLFREPDAARTVIDRGPGDRKGFNFTVAPLRWSPVAGAEFLAVAGRSGKDTSFVVLYYALGSDSYRLASSFIMRDEEGPIAFAYSAGIMPRFHFSSCWGCPGDTGKVLYRKPDRAVILQP